MKCIVWNMACTTFAIHFLRTHTVAKKNKPSDTVICVKEYCQLCKHFTSIFKFLNNFLSGMVIYVIWNQVILSFPLSLKNIVLFCRTIIAILHVLHSIFLFISCVHIHMRKINNNSDTVLCVREYC